MYVQLKSRCSTNYEQMDLICSVSCLTRPLLWEGERRLTYLCVTCLWGEGGPGKMLQQGMTGCTSSPDIPTLSRLPD